jgi:hypothetical protein
VDIDRLHNREDPIISQILFQKICSTHETMILSTAYGLLIYETTIVPIPPQPVKDSKEKKSSKKESRENDKPKITLNTQYKLSVLPDERVIDCLSFSTTQNEN